MFRQAARPSPSAAPQFPVGAWTVERSLFTRRSPECAPTGRAEVHGPGPGLAVFPKNLLNPLGWYSRLSVGLRLPCYPVGLPITSFHLAHRLLQHLPAIAFSIRRILPRAARISTASTFWLTIALVLGGCGGDESPVSAAAGARLGAQVDAIRQAAAAGDRAGAELRLAELRQAVTELRAAGELTGAAALRGVATRESPGSGA